MTTPQNTDTPPALPDRVYGDWEWDEKADAPANIYPARITGRWGGGVEFATDRQTAERIVAAQTAIRDESLNPEDIDRLEWEGDTLVMTDVAGLVHRYEADAEGLYHCGFGWTWSEWVEPTPMAPDRVKIAYAVHVEGALWDDPEISAWTTDVHEAADMLVRAAEFFEGDPDGLPNVMTIVRAEFTPDEWATAKAQGWVRETDWTLDKETRSIIHGTGDILRDVNDRLDNDRTPDGVAAAWDRVLTAWETFEEEAGAQR